MTTQLEEAELEMKLKGIDLLLGSETSKGSPSYGALLKERLLTLAEMMRR